MVPKKYDTRIDGKWQLSLPVEFRRKFDGRREVSVMTDRDGCLAIYPYGATSSDGEKVRLRRGSRRKYMRMTIPQELRNTTSFHYGHTVTIVSGRGCIKLWPRPPWHGVNERGAGRPPCNS